MHLNETSSIYHWLCGVNSEPNSYTGFIELSQQYLEKIEWLELGLGNR